MFIFALFLLATASAVPFPTQDTFNGKTKTNSFYDGCNVGKNCFGAPANCVETKDCKAVVAISVIDNRYEFELTAAPEASWVGVGLSDDDKMGDDSVIECVKDDSNAVQTYMSYTIIKPKRTAERDANQDNVKLLEGNVNDGSSYCRVFRETVTTVNNTVFDLANGKFHLLVAAGSKVSPTKVMFHDIAFIASKDKKNLSDVSVMN